LELLLNSTIAEEVEQLVNLVAKLESVALAVGIAPDLVDGWVIDLSAVDTTSRRIKRYHIECTLQSTEE